MPDPSLRLLPLPSQPCAPGAPWGGERGAPLLREQHPAPPRGRSYADSQGAGSAGSPGEGSRGATGPEPDGGSEAATAPRSDAVSGSGEDGSEAQGADAAGGPGAADAPGGRGGARERGGSHGQEDNPFAPPPEGTPDRPWQPRRPADGSGSHAGPGEDDARGRSPWGTQWSDQQPGRTPGRFGERPGNQGSPEGPQGQGGGLRWDPTDPAQRRARYALLSGMWSFFFALFGWRELALLLGALALYWGISSLRAKARRPDPSAPTATATRQPSGTTVPATGDGSATGPSTGPSSATDPSSASGSGGRPQATAAVSGLVTASLALAMVAATFTAQLVYHDYYACVNDALTSSAKHSCDSMLPQDLRSVLGTSGM